MKIDFLIFAWAKLYAISKSKRNFQNRIPRELNKIFYTPSFMHENDQRKNIDRLGDFDNKTPTHMATTHAISKSKRYFQNRIPRELDKNFYIPRISMTH